MSITFSGLATGLDTDSIVKDIMALERAPLERIETKKADETKRLQAYKQLNEKLDGLQSAVGAMNITSEVRTTKVSLSSEDAFSATATSAALGSYNVAVAQLSQVQKSVVSGFSDTSASLLGTGTVTVNGTEINVTAANNSLAGLAESINEHTDATGVSASIINDGDGSYHLVLTGRDADTSFTVTGNLVDAENAPIGFAATEMQAAQQAVAFIDGIKVVSNTNSITTAIEGITIDLNSVSSTVSAGTPEAGKEPWDWADSPVYETTRMSVEADTDTLKEKITSFVTAYNGVMEWIRSGYEEVVDSSEATSETEANKEKDGEGELLGTILRGDATVNRMKRQLQNMLTSAIDNGGEFSILAQIGISTNMDGTLRQDNMKLDAALANNFDDMVALLSGDDEHEGVMKGFNATLLNMTSGASGIYASQKSSYESKVDRFDSQIDRMELRLAKRENILRDQFTAMEQLISSLNAQGDFLTQQINALNPDK